jgi:hypothetical protein
MIVSSFLKRLCIFQQNEFQEFSDLAKKVLLETDPGSRKW